MIGSPPFFLHAHGKAQVLMAGCQNWKAKSPDATVCWVCMRSRAICLATFGTTSAIHADWIGAVAIGTIYRTITGDRPVPNYGLHGVLRVLLYVINGTRGPVVQLTGKAPATVGCSVLGRGAGPLVRTQFLEHPPTLNFGANHLKKWIQHPQKTPIPFLSPHNPHCRGGFLGGG